MARLYQVSCTMGGGGGQWEGKGLMKENGRGRRKDE